MSFNYSEEFLDKFYSFYVYRDFKYPEIMEYIYHLQNNSHVPKNLQINFFYFLSKFAFENDITGNIWKKYLVYELVLNENIFSLSMEGRKIEYNKVPKFVLKDLGIFFDLYKLDLNKIHLEGEILESITDMSLGNEIICNYNKKEEIFDEIILNLDNANELEDFVKEIIDIYANIGCGIFSLYSGFHIEDKKYIPISNLSNITFDDLIGYDRQKEILQSTVLGLINRTSNNNCLLYGEAGTGKSSSIKALLNMYYSKGLRIIEVEKGDYSIIKKVISECSKRNYSFIIFLDDLSFEENETDYKSLKAVMEGSLGEKPDNVAIYATSNRKHLVNETFRDDEIHENETIQEKLSLFSRFGVNIYFGDLEKKEYDSMLLEMSKKSGISVDENKIKTMGNAYELSHGGRSGRTAKQFIDTLKEKLKNTSK
ncbi:MAG: ATP-binding protein [Lachnospiraceae bacterium]|jgi:predicted AAA+ superfamily ATPase|nr:ATP-binding protein [Lachnospiraceae bacterium]